MEQRVFELLTRAREKEELVLITSYNEKTEENFGLSLSFEDAKELIISRNESLTKHKRVEFGAGILDKLIYTFCDSQYINQSNYAQTLMSLQDIFYHFKNESQDKLTDEELLEFMKEQYETVCYGDTEYLKDTCLERFAKAIRAGYSGYQQSGGSGEYEQFSEEQRWDRELYHSVLKELFWE